MTVTANKIIRNIVDNITIKELIQGFMYDKKHTYQMREKVKY